MSHGITSTDRFAEVRTGGKRAWHGLGDELPEGQDFVTHFRRLGIDWGTELIPMTYERNGVVHKTDCFMHVRADNGFALGDVKDGYKPFENMDVARFADNMLGPDRALPPETVGTLYGGRRVFAMGRLPQSLVVAEGDETRPYLLVSNGHGGFASFNVYLTTIRVVCNNTLTMSEKDLARGVRFHHTGDLAEKQKQARVILGLANAEMERFGEQCKVLAATQMSAGQVEHFMRGLWEKTFGKLDPSDDDAYQKAKAKQDAIVATWLENMENDRQRIASIRGTAWAAYNAVSEWHDHQRGRFLGVEESDARVHSNLFGASNKGKQVAFRSALQLVKA